MRVQRLVTILVLLALMLPASPARAAGVVGICDETHLRAALAGGGTVTFSCSGAITLTAPITIATDSTVDGSGQSVILSGNHVVRVFTVNAGIALNLNKLTIANGNAGYDDGGGIANFGTLTVSNSSFTGNTAGDGGGIYNDSGELTVTSGTFGDNSAHSGGGIENGGTATISNCTFTGNSGSGGGIENYGTAIASNNAFTGNNANASGGGISNYSVMIVINSTFFGNSVQRGGGGIFNSDGGTMTVINSTLSGNSAGRYIISGGGGILNSAGGTLTVINSTFFANSATSGRAIRNDDGTVTLKNTSVADTWGGGNCAGNSITNGGGNLSYPDTTCPSINRDPALGPLQNNGGPTQTMALGSGSAAIDAANDAICADAPVNNRDQRGIPRPYGPHCDIGAYEATLRPMTRAAFLPNITR